MFRKKTKLTEKQKQAEKKRKKIKQNFDNRNIFEYDLKEIHKKIYMDYKQSLKSENKDLIKYSKWRLNKFRSLLKKVLYPEKYKEAISFLKMEIFIEDYGTEYSYKHVRKEKRLKILFEERNRNL